MTDTTWDGSLPDEEEAQTTIDEALPEAPETEPSSSSDETSESGVDDGNATDAADPWAAMRDDNGLILGKFKDGDAFAKGYKNLETEFHASRQPQPDPEAADEYEFDPAFASEEAQNLLNYAVQGEAYAKQAYDHAQQNPQIFGLDAAKVQNELFQIWAQQNPVAAIEDRAARIVEERMAAFQQQYQPLQEQYHSQAIDIAVAQAKRDNPGFEEAQDAVLAHIQSIPGLAEAINTNPAYRSPEVLKGLLEQSYAHVFYRNYAAQMKAQAATADTAAPAAPAASKPRTASRSTASAQNDVEAMDEALFGTVLNRS